MTTLRPFLTATAVALLAGACASPRLAVPEPLAPVDRKAAGDDSQPLVPGAAPTAAADGLRVGATPALPGPASPRC